MLAANKNILHEKTDFLPCFFSGFAAAARAMGEDKKSKKEEDKKHKKEKEEDKKSKKEEEKKSKKEKEEDKKSKKEEEKKSRKERSRSLEFLNWFGMGETIRILEKHPHSKEHEQNDGASRSTASSVDEKNQGLDQEAVGEEMKMKMKKKMRKDFDLQL